MYKLANQVIDAYDDLYLDHLKKVAEARPQTYVMTPDEKAKLGDDDFALSYITKEAQKLNKFPVNTYDNTWLSNEYFPETYYKLAEGAATTAAFFIKKACKRFGIQPKSEITKLAADKENNLYFEERNSISEKNFINNLGDDPWYMSEKTASANEELKDFADLDNICGNYTHAQYVFSTPERVKIACEYFEAKHEKMPLELRHKYASAIQTRSEELGLGVQKGAISKYASDSYNGDLNIHILNRQKLIGESPLSGELTKLASVHKNYTPSQFAQLLHAFDKKAHLTQHYGSHLKNPYESTFAQAMDKNASYKWTNKTASQQLTSDEIEKVIKTHNTKIAEYFGKSIADDMKKDPVSIFESLPNDYKEIIAHIHNGSL